MPLLLLALLGSAPPAPPETSTATPAEAAQAADAVPPEVTARMEIHFDFAVDAQRALIAGELGAVRAAGEKLSKLEDDWPDPWAEPMNVMLQRADSLSDAGTLRVAAKEVASIAAACGDCHTKVGGGPPSVGVSKVPPQPFGENHMPQHAWAVNWMWFGIMAPNDEAWKRGAAQLAAEKQRWPASSEEPTPIGFQKLDGEVHKIGKESVKAKGADRERLFGELLSTCSRCHAWTESGPR